MVDKDKLLLEQKEEIHTLKKAISSLHSRLAHLERRNRANETAIHNNSRDIRNVANKKVQ